MQQQGKLCQCVHEPNGRNDDYVVLDMELLDEMVFFCGFDKVLNTGLLGWFNIEGLFYGSEPIHIDNSLLNMGLLRLNHRL